MFRYCLLLVATMLPLAPLSAQTPPRVLPVTESVHGITLVDEYRWMEEDSNAAEMAGWVKAEAARTRSALGKLSGRAEFAAAIRTSSSALTRVSGLQMAGGTTVFRRASAGDKVAKLIVVQGGKERVLLDPNQAGGGSVTAINNASLSPDGRRIAVHQAKGGGEAGEITVYDIASGQPVGKPIERIWGEFDLVWLGGDAVGYTQMREPGPGVDQVEQMRTFVTRLDGGAAPSAVLGYGLPGSDFASKEFPGLSRPPSSRWVLATAGGARADQRFFVARAADLLAGKPRWTSIASLDDRVRDVDLIGDTAFVLTTQANGAGQVLRRPIGAKGLGAPRVVLEGHERLILTGLAAATDGVYAVGHSDGVGQLFFSRGGNTKFVPVALPFEGGELFGLRRQADSRGVGFAYSGWFTNFRQFVALNGKVRDTGYGSTTWDGAKDFTADRLEATSADGTRVPLVVLRKGGAMPPGGMPTILDAYGGYGISSATPFYGRDFMAWIARGGAMAFCGVRGGGERGRAWHEGGRGLNKPRGHEDFQACAQTLKDKGIATAKGPVGTGTSMGGVLTPPAVLKRPELFAGLIARVGVLNPTRIGNAPNGPNQFDEIGDPAQPAAFKGLLAMDAFVMLADAKSLPPTLVTIGLNDRRVAPWFSAKFTARAQARFGADRVLLRADDDAGHGIGTAEDARVEETADIYAFAWNTAKN